MSALLALALLALGPSGARAAPGTADVCPWCRDDPARMAAAGIVSHGGFEFGREDTRAVERLLGWVDLVWIESAHFELGFGLGPYKVRLEEREGLRAELARLAEVLPGVDPKAKVLDPWLRAHLYAQRVEDQWRAFLELVRVDESAFPDGGTPWNLQGRYMGEGPYLGMKGKYELLLLPSKGASVAYLREHFGLTHEVTQRWHLPARGTLSVTIPTHQGKLREDRALHGHVAFNLAHLFLDGFKHYAYDTPIWLHEGLAHWMERRLSPDFNSFDTGEGSLALETRKSDWHAETARLAAAGELPSFSALVRLRTYPELTLADHFATWSMVEFLITTDPEAFAGLLGGLKGIWDLERRVPDGGRLPERQRELVRELYGASYHELDQRWRAWIALARREKRR